MKSGFIAGKAEESWAGPGPPAAPLLQGAPSSASRPALPQRRPRSSAAAHPAWEGRGEIPQPLPRLGEHPARTPQSFPSPKAFQCGRAPGSRPPSHKALAPPHLRGSPQGSGINHPPLQSSPSAGDTESPNRGAGAADKPPPTPLPAAPALVRLSSAFPVAPTQTGASTGHCHIASSRTLLTGQLL